MEIMTDQVKRHYLSPMPNATDPTPNPFPPIVLRGLALGAAVGALLGLLAAWLLWSGTLVIHGWEGMFSMGDFTFFFWTMLGIAFGGAVIGIGAILVTTPESHDAQTAQKHDSMRSERDT
jgi:heme exporter protein D